MSRRLRRQRASFLIAARAARFGSPIALSRVETAVAEALRGVLPRRAPLVVPLPLLAPLGLALFCVLAMVLLPSSARSIATLRIVLEALLLATGAVMFLHAHGRGLAGLFFGAGLFYGTILENTGINVGYFHEDAMKSDLVPGTAPLAIVLGWSFVLYMSISAAWALRARNASLQRSPILSAIAAAIAGLGFDLALDPLATALGCWVWHPELPQIFGDVPAMNFVTWFVVIATFAYAVFRVQAKHQLADGAPWPARTTLRLAIAAPLMLSAAALFVGVAVYAIEGPASPTLALLASAWGRTS